MPVAPTLLMVRDPIRTDTGIAGAQYFSFKRILTEMGRPWRTGSARRCGLSAYTQARLDALSRMFKAHGLRALIAATSAAGTSYHSPTVSLNEKY